MCQYFVWKIDMINNKLLNWLKYNKYITNYNNICNKLNNEFTEFIYWRRIDFCCRLLCELNSIDGRVFIWAVASPWQRRRSGFRPTSGQPSPPLCAPFDIPTNWNGLTLIKKLEMRSETWVNGSIWLIRNEATPLCSLPTADKAMNNLKEKQREREQHFLFRSTYAVQYANEVTVQYANQPLFLLNRRPLWNCSETALKLLWKVNSITFELQLQDGSRD